ncbi:methyltransferase, type 12 [Desulfosarcina variabilis str. Montpellier]|uniref:class I SAM-dependent methyltransferase n=1 Tax=Desulfosarcina variabilis TaxID=2300 RepID=UPI003AFB7ACC
MTVIQDLYILYRIVLAPIRGTTHAQRLESFYGAQAQGYDDFRRRLLQGRRELIDELNFSRGEIWLDMGAGTGANLDFAAHRVPDLGQVYLVDLCPSLLAIAKKRIANHHWSNVETIQADAATFKPPRQADVITFSYSLTMIPNWIQALINARALLKPGGRIGVVDFYVSPKHPAAGRVRHNWWMRHFWPIWFETDNVHPSPDHLPFLSDTFKPQTIVESTAKIPYLPGIRVPYYRFIGR